MFVRSPKKKSKPRAGIVAIMREGIGEAHPTGDRSTSSRSYCQGIVHDQDTGHGSTFQMEAAYSAIVRSLENLPEPATFKMALRAQASGLAYSSISRWSASR